MKKLSRWALKSIPFIVGLAWVFNGMEQKQRRRFSVLRVVFLFLSIVFALLSITAVTVFSHMDAQYISEEDKGACVVVFGAAVWRDDQPSQALYDRVSAGLDVYNQGVNCLWLSGGASKFGAHEADVMKKIALQLGARESDIVLDYHGDNTLATMMNLHRPELKHVFVSNDFHLARIGLMARRLGFDDYDLHAAPYLEGRYHKDTEYFLREVFGYGIVWLKL